MQVFKLWNMSCKGIHDIFATILLGTACAPSYTIYFNITLGLATTRCIFSTFLMNPIDSWILHFHPLLNTSAQLVCMQIYRYLCIYIYLHTIYTKINKLLLFVFFCLSKQFLISTYEFYLFFEILFPIPLGAREQWAKGCLPGWTMTILAAPNVGLKGLMTDLASTR